MASSTSIAQVRRLLYGGSTRTGTLSTGDIAWFADNRANVWLAASAAALSEAQYYASQGNRKVGDLEIDYSASMTEWRQLSENLRLEGLRSVKPFSGGISVTDKSNKESQTDRDAPAFKRDQFDYLGGSYSTR